MKKIRLLILFIVMNSLIAFHCSAQEGILVDTIITFKTIRQGVTIDTANHQNIWEIGRAKKVFFDSANTVPVGIVTDTVNDYPPDNLSSFIIDIKSNSTYPYWSGWGSAMLSFRHKYNTDSLYDGGYVEIQYDTSKEWINVVNDDGTSFNQNFYNTKDTILGNIPAFNGNSNVWVNSTCYWRWLELVKSGGIHNEVKLKFVFESSVKKVNLDGWMIDNIEFTIYQVGGGVNELGMRNGELGINVYPNPVNSLIDLSYSLMRNSLVSLKIYDLLGNEVAILVNKGEEKGDYKIEFDAKKLTDGVYLCKLEAGNIRITRKIVVMH